MEYLQIAELEYITLYRAKKWTASHSNPALGFFVTNSGNETNSGGDNDKIQGGGGGYIGVKQKNNRW